MPCLRVYKRICRDNIFADIITILEHITTTKSGFNIGVLTSVVKKTDVNEVH